MPARVAGAGQRDRSQRDPGGHRRLLLFKELLCQGPIGGGSESIGLVFEDGFAVAGRFSQANRARHDGSEDIFGEMLLNFADNLLGEVVAHIHCHENATDFEIWIAAKFINLGHNAVDFRKAFQREIFALNGDEQFVRSREGIGHEDAKGWGAVQKHKVERSRFSQVHEGVPQAREMIFLPGHFDFGSSEVDVARDQPEVFPAGGDHRVRQRTLAEQRSVNTVVFNRVMAQSAGGIPLRIEINQKHAFSQFREGRSKVHGGRSFSHPSFLIGHCDNFHAIA